MGTEDAKGSWVSLISISICFTPPVPPQSLYFAPGAGQGLGDCRETTRMGSLPLGGVRFSRRTL